MLITVSTASLTGENMVTVKSAGASLRVMGSDLVKTCTLQKTNNEFRTET